MDHLIQQFIAAAKKGRELFESFHKNIEKIVRSIEGAAADYHAQHQQPAGPPPVILGELRRPQSEIDQQEAREAREEARDTRQEDRDRTRLRFEAAGLAVGCILAAANVGLLWVTKEVAESTRDAAAAANSQAQVTKISIEATVQQYRLDQRAWMGVEDVAGTANVGEYFAVVIHTKNTGKTPARNVKFDGKLTPRQSMPDASLDCVLTQKSSTRTVVAPNAFDSIPIRADIWGKLTKDAIQNLGTKRIYIHGCMLYDDIFTQRHWLTLCSYWRDDIKAFAYCDTGNDTGDGDGPKH